MFYQGDTVRLLRQLPGLALERHSEGRVTGIRRGQDGQPLAAEICFSKGSQAITAEVPFDSIELVVDASAGCTAVFWGMEKEPQVLLEAGIHAMLDHGFEMCQGLNVQQLTHDSSLRVWQKGERLSDPMGNQALVCGAAWDGCVIAFSGPQRFVLEFRFRGHRRPCLMLHQRWETFDEQRRTTAPAMTLLRVLLNLYVAVQSECCATPVAGNWLMDEDWNSLLQQPYFPDLFLLPQSRLPQQLPPLYRAQNLVKGNAILTTLPVKFSPTDDPIERTPRELQLNALRACTAIGEKAYDQMYEAHGSATGLYSDAKEAFYDAISIANELGLHDEAEQLSNRLAHIKAVFRSQFS